jgi:hypothetical protein
MPDMLTAEQFKALIARYRAGFLPFVRMQQSLGGELSLTFDASGADLSLDGRPLGRLTLARAQEIFRQDGAFDIEALEEWIVAQALQRP